MPNTKNIDKLIEVLRADQGNHFIMQQYVGYLDSVDLAEVADFWNKYDRYASPTWRRDNPVKYIECKTACCLAGWANTLRMEEEGFDWKAIEGVEFRQQFTAQYPAAKWLGIKEYQINELFVPVYYLGWFDKQKPIDRMNAGIRVLEILRDTGEVDWPRALKEVGLSPERDLNRDR